MRGICLRPPSKHFDAFQVILTYVGLCLAEFEHISV